MCRKVTSFLPSNRLRRPVWALGVVLALAGCSKAGDGPPRTAAPVALFIAINQYSEDGDSGWPDLASPRADAEALAAVLEEQYGFETRRLYDAEARKEKVLAALGAVCRLGSKTPVLIFHAGHGYWDPIGQRGYWIPFGASASGEGSARAEWIAHDELVQQLLAATPRRVLLISDSCFSGALLDRRVWTSGAAGQDERPARFALCSGDLAPVPDSAGTRSVFAQALVEFLAHPPADEFTAEDLGRGVRRQVQRLTGQVVRMGPLAPEADGPFVLRRRP